MRKQKIKDYKIYGHDKGSKQVRYLFTTQARNVDEAVDNARKRVKGAKIIDKARLVGGKRRGGSEDDRQRRKYDRGGRIEAYTMGEALGSKNWP